MIKVLIVKCSEAGYFNFIGAILEVNISTKRYYMYSNHNCNVSILKSDCEIID